MENPIKMDDLGGKTHYFRKHLNAGLEGDRFLSGFGPGKLRC